MKQSIVTWHEWPENGVEGLPEGEPLLIREHDGGIKLQLLHRKGNRIVWSFTDETVSGPEVCQFSHYALASDLETVHEIDGDKCTILPRALIDRARASKPTVSNSSIVQDEDPDQEAIDEAKRQGAGPFEFLFKAHPDTQSDEDRVRWLAERACVLMCAVDDMTEETAVEWVRRIEREARAQVERERKEGGHGMA